MCVASEQQQGHAGAAAAAAQVNEANSAGSHESSTSPERGPGSCASTVEAMSSRTEPAPTSAAASLPPHRNRVSSRVLQAAERQTAKATETRVSTAPVVAEVTKAAAEEAHVRATGRADVTDVSAGAAPPTDAAPLAEVPARASRAAAGRTRLARNRKSVCEADSKATAGSAKSADDAADGGATTGGAGAVGKRRTRRGVMEKKRVETDVRRSSIGKNNSDTGKCLPVRDSSSKGHRKDSCPRGRKGKLVVSDAAPVDASEEEEAEQGTACTRGNAGAHDGQSSSVGAAVRGGVRKSASDEEEIDRRGVRSSKNGKRKEYQRMRACLRPRVVPLRTPAVTYPVGALLADASTTHSAACSGFAVSAGTLGATAGGSEVPSDLGASSNATASALASDLLEGNAIEAGRKRTASAYSGCHRQILAAHAASAIIAGAGDGEEETWRSSSRSRAGAAGGRSGRFSAAERAAVCAALRQYAIDNGLERGTVEAAVEHLMTAQDASSSPSEGKRKRGGRPLRFAAIARWLPQRSCASIYFYIRRNLSAHIGTKKHGPWSADEVQTLLEMESELRVSHPRTRFARIAALLNRTASSVYDKWKEIGPRLASLSCNDTSGKDHELHPVIVPEAVAAKGDTAAAAKALRANEDGTGAGVVLPEDGTATRSLEAAAYTAEASLTGTSRRNSRPSDHAPLAGRAEETRATRPKRRLTRQSCETEVQPLLQEQQQLQLLDGERPTESRGRTSRNEREDNSGDLTTADEDAAEGVAAKCSIGNMAREGPSGIRSLVNIVQPTTQAGVEISTEGDSGPTTGPAEAQGEALPQETNATRADVDEPIPGMHMGERHLREGEDAGGETNSVTAVKTVKSAVLAGNCLERRARFGTTEQIQKLLQAVQEQTGECLPVTGISWSSVQKQAFPHVSASQLRLFYTTRLVPKELAKRMGVPAAEPVLLRFVVRCLDSLLNVKQAHQGVHDVRKETASDGAAGQCVSTLPVPAPAALYRRDPPTTLRDSHGGEGMVPVPASEETEFDQVSQLRQEALNGLIIDNVCDVDWLEILPFCPTALPPYVFRRAVVTLLPTKRSEGEQRPESMHFAQQVFLLKERLQLEGNSTNAGRDAALLLRAALPREALAQAVRHELRKRRWKRSQTQQQDHRIIERSHTVTKRKYQGPEEGQPEHQGEAKRTDHENGELSDDGARALTAVDGSGGHASAAGHSLNSSEEEFDENREKTVVEGHRKEEEEEEEAREQAIEREMTEAEREAKWHREEKLLGRAAVLAVLRRVGGKELRRRRHRNRQCLRIKEHFDGWKCISRVDSHVSEVRSSGFVAAHVESTIIPFCDTQRIAVSAQPGGEASACREEPLVLAQLKDIEEGNETSEALEAAQLHQQSQKEHSEAAPSGDSQQQQQHPTPLEKEQAATLLPQSDGMRPSKRYKRRTRPSIVMEEVSDDSSRQHDNIHCSEEVLGTPVNGQQGHSEEKETTTEAVTTAVGDLDQQVEGLMPGTTMPGTAGVAGDGWQQLGGQECSTLGASGQALVTPLQNKKSNIVADGANSDGTEKGTADPAVDHDVENVFQEQCESAHDEEALAAGTREFAAADDDVEKVSEQLCEPVRDEKALVEGNTEPAASALDVENVFEEQGEPTLDVEALVEDSNVAIAATSDRGKVLEELCELVHADVTLVQGNDEAAAAAGDVEDVSEEPCEPTHDVEALVEGNNQATAAASDMGKVLQELCELVHAEEALVQGNNEAAAAAGDVEGLSEEPCKPVYAEEALVECNDEAAAAAGDVENESEEPCEPVHDMEAFGEGNDEAAAVTREVEKVYEEPGESVHDVEALVERNAEPPVSTRDVAKVFEEQSEPVGTEESLVECNNEAAAADDDVEEVYEEPCEAVHARKTLVEGNDEADASDDDVEEVFDEPREQIYVQEALTQGNNETDPEQDGTGRTDATAVSGGKECMNKATRKRRKKKENPVVNANLLSDDVVCRFPVSLSVGGNEQLPVHNVPLMEQERVTPDLHRERKKKQEKVNDEEQCFRKGPHGDSLNGLFTGDEGIHAQSIDASVPPDEAHDLQPERKKKRKKMKKGKENQDGDTAREGLHGDVLAEPFTENEGTNRQTIDASVPPDEAHNLQRERKKRLKKMKKKEEAFRETLHGDVLVEHLTEKETHMQSIDTSVPPTEAHDIQRKRKKKRKKMKKDEEKHDNDAVKEGLHGDVLAQLFTENEGTNRQAIDATVLRDETHDLQRERKKKREKMKKDEKKQEEDAVRDGLRGGVLTERLTEEEEEEDTNTQRIDASVPATETHDLQRERKKKRKKMKRDEEKQDNNAVKEGLRGGVLAESFAENESTNTEAIGAAVPRDETHDLQRERKKKRKKMKTDEEKQEQGDFTDGLRDDVLAEPVMEKEGTKKQTVDASVPRDEVHDLQRERKKKRKKMKKVEDDAVKEGLCGDVLAEPVTENDRTNTQAIAAAVPRDEIHDLQRERKKKRKKMKKGEEKQEEDAFRDGLHGGVLAEPFMENEQTNRQTIDASVPLDETRGLERERKKRQTKKQTEDDKQEEDASRDGMHGDDLAKRLTENEETNTQSIDASVPPAEAHDLQRERKKKRKKIKKREENMNCHSVRAGLHGDVLGERFTENEGTNSQTVDASVSLDETHDLQRERKKKRKQMGKKEEAFRETLRDDVLAVHLTEKEVTNTQRTDASIPPAETHDLQRERKKKRKKIKKREENKDDDALKEGLRDDVVAEPFTENERTNTQAIDAAVPRDEIHDLQRERKKKRKKMKTDEEKQEEDAARDAMHGDVLAEPLMENEQTNRQTTDASVPLDDTRDLQRERKKKRKKVRQTEEISTEGLHGDVLADRLTKNEETDTQSVAASVPLDTAHDVTRERNKKRKKKKRENLRRELHDYFFANRFKENVNTRTVDASVPLV